MVYTYGPFLQWILLITSNNSLLYCSDETFSVVFCNVCCILLLCFVMLCRLENRDSFLVVFSFFEKTTYCCRARRLSVRPSVCLSVRLSVRPSVCPSVEIISFRGNSLSNRPIKLKIGLNVREGVVHVR